MVSYYILAYPLIATIFTIYKPLKPDLLHWCIWWVVYELFVIANILLWWIPLISFIETIVLLAMYSNISSNYLRNAYVVPNIKNLYKKFPASKVWYTHVKKMITEGLVQILIQSRKNSDEIDE